MAKKKKSRGLLSLSQAAGVLKKHHEDKHATMAKIAETDSFSNTEIKYPDLSETPLLDSISPVLESPKDFRDRVVGETMTSICGMLASSSIYDVLILIPKMLGEVIDESYSAGANKK